MYRRMDKLLIWSGKLQYFTSFHKEWLYFVKQNREMFDFFTINMNIFFCLSIQAASKAVGNTDTCVYKKLIQIESIQLFLHYLRWWYLRDFLAEIGWNFQFWKRKPSTANEKLHIDIDWNIQFVFFSFNKRRETKEKIK